MSHVDDLREDRVIEVTWAEILLFVAVVGLTIQMFPQLYWSIGAAIAVCFQFVFNACDIRQWSWRSYAAANVVACVALVLVRFFYNRE